MNNSEREMDESGKQYAVGGVKLRLTALRRILGGLWIGIDLSRDETEHRKEGAGPPVAVLSLRLPAADVFKMLGNDDSALSRPQLGEGIDGGMEVGREETNQIKKSRHSSPSIKFCDVIKTGGISPNPANRCTFTEAQEYGGNMDIQLETAWVSTRDETLQWVGDANLCSVDKVHGRLAGHRTYRPCKPRYQSLVSRTSRFPSINGDQEIFVVFCLRLPPLSPQGYPPYPPSNSPFSDPPAEDSSDSATSPLTPPPKTPTPPPPQPRRVVDSDSDSDSEPHRPAPATMSKFAVVEEHSNKLPTMTKGEVTPLCANQMEQACLNYFAAKDTAPEKQVEVSSRKTKVAVAMTIVENEIT
ncbi:hypothetical protein B0H12DRAFT_1076562 [Mycena haematopus]|nr:hypothetical protein B0H12DRAFT_1076562 [Mycena haematopus]